MTDDSPQLEDDEAWRALSLSQRLQRLLAEQGLSQAELAKRTGIVSSTINKLVVGARSPTLEQLDKLAMGLGVGRERRLALQPQAEPRALEQRDHQPPLAEQQALRLAEQQALEQRLRDAEDRAAHAQQGREAVEQRLRDAEDRAAHAQQGGEALALQHAALVAELGEAVARESRLRDEVATLGEELAEARRQLEALEPTREQAPAPGPDRSRGAGRRRCTECSGLWRACVGAVSG
jgi:transcriptional regulator with XRE-family HTH domain